MPYSDYMNKSWTEQQLLRLKPKTVLDVGPGAGVYGEMVARLLPNTRCDAIEIWAPYIEKFNLEDKYANVWVSDARIFSDYQYDLVIFGDVIEHMSERDASELWRKMASQARAAVISIPIIHYPQHAHEGNPYEAHVEEDWNTERVLRTFSGIVDYKEFEVTGVYLAQFKDDVNV